MTFFPLSIKTVVAAEARIRKSVIGPPIALLAYSIWHKTWDIFFAIRSIFRGHEAELQIAGIDFQYDMRDRAVARIVYIFGAYETREVEFLVDRVVEGMTFIDIGANSGFFTIVASKLVGQSGKVISFEPSPENMRRLKSNIEANNLQNVQANESAISQESGPVTLHLSRINPGDHRTYESDDARILNAGSKRRILEAHGISLDDYLAEISLDIDVIKMDIQGAEHHALKGMRDTIMKHRNVLLMTEYWPHGLRSAGSSPREFLGDLVGHGFRLFVARDHGRAAEVYPDDLELELTEDRHVTIFCKRAAL